MGIESHGFEGCRPFPSSKMNRFLFILVMTLVGAKAGWCDSSEEIVRAERQVQFLENYCVSCHKEGKDKGGLRVDEHDPLDVWPGSIPFWKEILISVKSYDMPPEDEPQPSKEEWREAVAWYEEQIEKHKPFEHRYLHQLSMVEYEATVAGLLGIDHQPKRPDARQAGVFDVSLSYLLPEQVSAEELTGYAQISKSLLDQADLHQLAQRLAPRGEAESSVEWAQRLFAALLRRAYGRAVSEEETRTYRSYFLMQVDSGIDTEVALRSSLLMLLHSPKFLQHSDSPEVPADQLMARKLSYYFQGKGPDEELISLAKSGELKDRATLGKIVEEFLKDEEIRQRFAEEFVHRWYLNLAMAAGAPVIPGNRFQESSPAEQEAMLAEAVALFDALLRDNGDLRELAQVPAQDVVRAQVPTGLSADAAKRDAWLLKEILQEAFDIQPWHHAKLRGGAVSLQQLLVDDPDHLSRVLIDRFLVYGHCFPLRTVNQEKAEPIIQDVAESGYGLRTLLIATLASPAF